MGRRRRKTQAAWYRVTAAASSAAMLGILGVAGTSLAAPEHAAAARLAADSTSCHLGNGVKHVVQITFDNVHYFRDNPNIPSDLEMMPNEQGRSGALGAVHPGGL